MLFRYLPYAQLIPLGLAVPTPQRTLLPLYMNTLLAEKHPINHHKNKIWCKQDLTPSACIDTNSTMIQRLQIVRTLQSLSRGPLPVFLDLNLVQS